MAFGLGRGGRELTLKIVSDTAAIKKATSETATGIQKIGKSMSGAIGGLLAVVSVDRFLSFLGDAAAGAAEDERQVKLLQRTVKNLGLSAGQTQSDIDGMVSSWAKLGRTDTQVRSALKRSVEVTDDWRAARDLANISMDVATSLGISEEEAVNLVTKATKNTKRAVEALGIEYREGATPLQNYTQITENFAGATAAQVKGIDKLKVGVGEAVDSIGDWVNSGIEGWAMLADRAGFWADVARLEMSGVNGQYQTLLEDINAINNDAVREAWDTRSELNAAQRAAAADAARTADAIGKSLDPEDIKDRIKPEGLAFSDFFRIEFTTFTSDLISAATRALNEPSNAEKWRAFWKVFKEKAYDKSGQLTDVGKNVLLTIGDGIRNGQINPSDLGKPLGRAVDKISKDQVLLGKTEDAVQKLFPGKIKPVIKVEPQWRFGGGTGGGTFVLRPLSLPAGGGAAVASRSASDAIVVRPVTVNVTVQGADPQAVVGAIRRYSAVSGGEPGFQRAIVR
jgi:hypothetical protein